ncbi:MAG: lamin tail domain-containing protein [Methanomassiliicoccus sp.]|nr:lamin tail domain-containing protein [Methanomassiliicoccus sp.]
MRGLYILVLLVLVLPTAQPGPSSPLGADMGYEAISYIGGGSFLLSEVCPGRPGEYVLLTNQGSESSLLGWSLTDGEGTLTVQANVTVARGGHIAFVTNATSFAAVRPEVAFMERGNAALSWSGRYQLADGGDEVLLCSPDGTVVDALAYGASTYSGPGWSGGPTASVTKGHAAVRGGADTDTSADWSIEPPGRSKFAALSFQAVVEPFSAPENAAARIVRELTLATLTVRCSVYEISDPEVAEQLAKCARRGIEVSVLVEGQPVGGMSERSKDAIATMRFSGVDVRELCSNDSYKRYDYLHSKYMVVDGRRVTIMSENWGGGLSSNRGWGVTLDSMEAGQYFGNVFDNDFGGPLDVRRPKAEGRVMDPIGATPAGGEVARYRCEVSTLLSPDHSAVSLKDLIDRARDTVLVQQMSVDGDWLSEPSLLGSLISAAERGVTVRVLLDSSWGGKDNGMVIDGLNRNARADGLDLEARMISPHHGLSVMHNKGLVVDDRTVISSINWGDGALYQNREVGAAVVSDQVSAYFSALFWEDWSEDPVPPQARLPWTYLRVQEGEPVLLDAGGSSDNAPPFTVEWDIDEDGIADNTSLSWTVRLPVGNNSILLTVRDRGNNSATAMCWVEVIPRGSPGFEWTAPLLSLPILFAAIVTVWKRIIDRNKH